MVNNNGRVTITFDPELLENPINFIKEAVVQINNKDDGTPSLSTGQLMNLLVRVLAMLTILSSEKVSDAYSSACHYSGFISDAMKEALDRKFDITIVLESPPENLN